MEQLSATDLRRLIEQIDSLHAAGTVEELAEATLAGLSALIPCDVAGWNEFDLRTGAFSARGYPSGYLTEERLVALDEVDRYNPILEHVAGDRRYTVSTLSDFLSEREFHASPLYTEYFRDVGVEDQLSAFVYTGDPMVSVALNRSRRGFSERDRTLLTVLGAHAVGAYAGLRERDWLRRRVAALTGESTAAGVPPVAHAAALGLTERHAEVLTLAAEGLTTREIAERLVVSSRTIDKHFENIFQRLGVRTRGAAIDRLLAAAPPA